MIEDSNFPLFAFLESVTSLAFCLICEHAWYAADDKIPYG